MRYGRRKLTVICGAKNRKGLPCQCKLLLKGNKCKFHGGMSTGPKTPEGKARSAANLLLVRRRNNYRPKTSEGTLKAKRSLIKARKRRRELQALKNANDTLRARPDPSPLPPGVIAIACSPADPAPQNTEASHGRERSQDSAPWSSRYSDRDA